MFSLRPFILIALLLIVSIAAAQPPINDDCDNAIVLPITNGGFGFGTLLSDTIDFTLATLQVGETFANTNTNRDKSVWFQFTLPTTRQINIDIDQISGGTSSTTNASYTTYKTNGCPPFPGQALVEDDLSANTSASTFNVCLKAGTYYIQVTANNFLGGLVQLSLTTGPAAGISGKSNFDLPSQAGSIGNITRYEHSIANATGCQSIDSPAEQICTGLSAMGLSTTDYTQSTWYTFRTDNHVDYLAVYLQPSGAGNPLTAATVGYTLYQGDIVSNPSVVNNVIDGCVALTYPSDNKREYVCDLLPNTTYSIRLLLPTALSQDIRLLIRQLGGAPTKAPQPVLSQMDPTNVLGIINPGNSRIVNDHLACNAFLSDPAVACGSVNPLGNFSGQYDLTTWISFSLSAYGNVEILANKPQIYNCSKVYLRLFGSETTNNCADVQVGAIMAQGRSRIEIPCMPPGDYSLQILGRSQIGADIENNCLSDLGRPVNVTINTQPTFSTRFNLRNATAFDTINGLRPLQTGVTYLPPIDTFSCDSTVLPPGAFICNPLSTQGIYRELVIGDGIPSNAILEEGILVVAGSFGSLYRLYKGSASSIAIAQNTFSYPSVLNGLTPYLPCITGGGNAQQFCVDAGVYTLVGLGNPARIGFQDAPALEFRPSGTMFADPLAPEVLDTLSRANDEIFSTRDSFSCIDNAVTIDGQPPCGNGTKAIYREFYLADSAVLRVNQQGRGQYLIFEGQVSASGTSGLSALLNTEYNECFDTLGFPNCDILPPGWYTIVDYASGATFTNQATYQGGNQIGFYSQPEISILDSAGSKFNRPYKASEEGVTDYVNWTTPEIYPRHDTIYMLQEELFDCTDDMPFSSHPTSGCQPTDNRVAYYTFTITKPSFIVISAIDFPMSSRVYPFDVRQDSLLMQTVPPIQPCIIGDAQIRLCNVQPGTYTLVITGGDNIEGERVTPELLIDSVGISKYDHASNAYDFGRLIGDGQWYSGKQNLADTTNSQFAPSYDVIFCSTGAQTTDPVYHSCPTDVNWWLNSNIYPGGINYPMMMQYGVPRGFSRRNLWYTFTLSGIGTVELSVNDRTQLKNIAYPWSLYKSDVNGNVPFSQLQSNGDIDSTLIDGLSLVIQSDRFDNPPDCYHGSTGSFNVCDPNDTSRYYLIIDAPAVDYPNMLLDVYLNYDSTEVSYDHCYTANVINGLNQLTAPYTDSILTSGTYVADTGSFFCATADMGDNDFGDQCQGNGYFYTLWYKVQVGIAGRLRVQYDIVGLAANTFNPNEVILLRDDDTTSAACDASGGLVELPLDATTFNATQWGQACVTPGTYYFMFTGCGFDEQRIVPTIQIGQDQGDRCDDPIVSTIGGVGNSTTTAIVDCHTMGDDFGEDGSNLLCFTDVVGFKSTWFRVDITDTSNTKYDLALRLAGTVTATPVEYRVLYGDCQSMIVDLSSCSSIGNGFTLECLSSGSYYVQVFTPENAAGQLDLDITTTINANANCRPFTPNFGTTPNCDSTAIAFTNLTSGPDLVFTWDFGDGSPIETAYSPTHLYSSIDTPTVYTVSMTTTDTANAFDTTISKLITVLPLPVSMISGDTLLCLGDSVFLDAMQQAMANYEWSVPNLGASSLMVNASGTYYVTVTVEKCVLVDSINVLFQSAPLLNLGPNVNACEGDTIVLDAFSPSATYLWSTGETAPSIEVTINGSYDITAAIGNCQSSDTIEVLFNPSPLLAIGSDTTVCVGDTVMFSANYSLGTFLWDNGATSSSLTTDVANNYTLIYIDTNGCSDIAQVELLNYPEIFHIFNTSEPSCYGDNDGRVEAIITGGSSSTGYNQIWAIDDSVLANTSTVIDDAFSGVYTITTTDATGCNKIDTLQLLQPDELLINSVTSTNISCFGELDGSITIEAIGGTLPYRYSINSGVDFTNDNIRTGLDVGSYGIVVRDDNGCEAIDTNRIQLTSPTETYVTIVPDSSFIRFGEEVELIAQYPDTFSSVVSFNWQPGDAIVTSNTIDRIIAAPLDTTLITVLYTDEDGCTALDTAFIFVAVDSLIAYTPNIFTPNGDGVNDDFIVEARGVDNIELKVFDRWGELIFNVRGDQPKWDGTFHGREMSPGVFVYEVEITFLDDRKLKRVGTVTLIR